jgi:hypothetical protein
MYNFTMERECVKELILFTSHLESSEANYCLNIERIIKDGPNDLGRAILIAPDYHVSRFYSWFVDEDSKIISDLRRGDDHRHVMLFSFDEFGELTLRWDSGGAEVNGDRLCEDICFYGLKNLIDLNSEQIFMHAPVGTVFKKPSGDRSRLFIKSAEMAIGCDQVRFVAYCLLCVRPTEVVNVYIDTSGISIFVEAMISILGGFDKKYLDLNYYSFNSYGGLEQCINRGDSSGDWIIVSASLSNNMGRKISSINTRIKDEQILTLLSPRKIVSDGSIGERVLFDISSIEDYRRVKIEDSPIMELQVCGENFYVPVKEPKEIALRATDTPKSIQSFVEHCSQTNILSFDTFDKNRFRIFHFNFSNIEEAPRLYSDYLEWVQYLVDWKIPASVQSVVMDVDNVDARRLVDDIEKAANKSFIRIDFSSPETLIPDAGVLVVSPVISSGRKYAKLNSILRIIKHSGVRIFLSPFITFSNSDAFDLFKKSLCYGPKGRKYIFESFREIYLGDMNNILFRSEEDLIQSLSSTSWDERLREIENRSIGARKNVGLLSNSSCDSFTTDFAFWNTGYAPADVNSASVLWTVSALLQAVREYDSDPAKRDRSLHHNVNQYSVLDPENFERFNDPLIQSCLWRCAYSHELNYSTSAKLSEKFFNTMCKLISDHLFGNGNAALDLLLGVAMGHIVLGSKTMDSLKQYLRSLDSDCGRLNDLIGIVCGVREATHSESVAEF